MDGEFSRPPGRGAWPDAVGASPEDFAAPFSAEVPSDPPTDYAADTEPNAQAAPDK